MRKYLLLLLMCLCPAANRPRATTINLHYTGENQLQTGVVQAARQVLGSPYRWSGITPKGFDCSGLVYYVFQEVTGNPLPRIVTDLMRKGTKVTGTPQPADLLFFDTDGKGQASHVGISLGGNSFIHAASAGRKTGVIISSLDEKYYRPRFLGGRRLLQPGIAEIRIELDSEKLVKKYPVVLTPGIPVPIGITSQATRKNGLRFQAAKNGKTLINKHFGNFPRAQELRAWFIPDADDWTITVSDDIKGELAVLHFTAGSGG